MQDWREENLLQTIEEGEADRVEFKAELSGSAPEKSEKPSALSPTICLTTEKKNRD